MSAQNGTLWETIRQALRGLQYGHVQLVVHDGRVIRLERVEKIRVESETKLRPTASAETRE